MEKTNRLKMHTSLIPGIGMPNENDGKQTEKKMPLRKTLHKDTHARRKPKSEYIRKRPPASERLLRNTAVACALLLSVMTLRNIDSPFTNRITGAIKSAVSMNLNLTESIGGMSFVQSFIPESALVFLNIDASGEKSLPVSGAISHEWSEGQPWIEYITMNEESVFAVDGGTVTAATKSDKGDFTVMITHEDGTQAIYAYLAACHIKSGDEIMKGDPIGVSGIDANARLYFEYRKNGKSADPSVYLKNAAS